MREIHEIREQLYEEMKTMTPEEYTALVIREAEELAKEYVLKLDPAAEPLQNETEDVNAALSTALRDIVRSSEAWAETPEGRDHEFRLNFSRNLAKALKARKLTNIAFCQRIGMKNPQFSRIIQGDENITMSLIRRIAEGLDIPADRLFKQPRKAVGAKQWKAL
jgi:antitoxin component HigA of HigAB toxin-antitoxin module